MGGQSPNYKSLFLSCHHTEVQSQFTEKKWKDLINFWCRKRTLKVRILQSLTRLDIILVSLTKTWFSEEMLISTRCICGLLLNLLIKSLTVSGPDQFPLPLVEEGFFGFLWEFSTLQIRVFLQSVNITGFPYHTACMSFWVTKRQAISTDTFQAC